jgi:serine/threonine protein kinase
MVKFSYGILIFEILSFRRPFENLRGMAIQQKLSDGKATLADFMAHLPAAQQREYLPLVSVMEQCIAVDPAGRPSISFLVLTMKNLLGPRASSSSPNASPRPNEK